MKRFLVAAVIFATTGPALAQDLPVDKINAAMKGHAWTFPVEGKSTTVWFKTFRHEKGSEYAIVVEVR